MLDDNQARRKQMAISLLSAINVAGERIAEFMIVFYFSTGKGERVGVNLIMRTTNREPGEKPGQI